LPGLDSVEKRLAAEEDRFVGEAGRAVTWERGRLSGRRLRWFKV
jgi:hypothetical protein